MSKTLYHCDIIETNLGFDLSEIRAADAIIIENVPTERGVLHYRTVWNKVTVVDGRLAARTELSDEFQAEITRKPRVDENGHIFLEVRGRDLTDGDIEHATMSVRLIPLVTAEREVLDADTPRH